MHRDIKPANLMRDEGGVVKLADLGLARLVNAFADVGAAETHLTQGGGILGTAAFMPR